MADLKLNLEKDTFKLNIELQDCDQELVKCVLDRVIDDARENNNSTDLCGELEKFVAAGYEAMKFDIEGLHNPTSEFEHDYVAKKELKESYEEASLTIDNTTDKSEKKEELESVKKQLWYICSCGNKGKHFIPSSRKYVTCHNCDEKMMVRLANPAGNQNGDEYGNYYIAGEFRRTLKAHEEEEEFWKNFKEDH